mgnify:CR=1 FL=1
MLFKHKLILIFNAVVLCLFCLFGLIMIEPAYNHFVQYARLDSLLPIPTQWAISARLALLILPVVWIAISCRVYQTLRTQEKVDQLRTLFLFFLVTMSSGLLVTVFYALAGILPFLKIGVSG